MPSSNLSYRIQRRIFLGVSKTIWGFGETPAFGPWRPYALVSSSLPEAEAIAIAMAKAARAQTTDPQEFRILLRTRVLWVSATRSPIWESPLRDRMLTIYRRSVVGWPPTREAVCSHIRDLGGSPPALEDGWWDLWDLWISSLRFRKERTDA